MAILDSLIDFMQQQGVYEVYLPFLLTFAMFYALLRKSNIFGKSPSDNVGNNISIIVSIVAALFVVIFTPVGVTLSHYFTMFFTQASIAMIAILVLIMISSLFMGLPFFEGTDVKDKFKEWVKWVLALGTLLVLFMFVTSGGVDLFMKFGVNLPNMGIASEDIGLILLVVGTGAIIFLTTRGEGVELTPEEKAARKAKAGG